MAHPDDEIIFGWPAFKQASKIIICSTDIDNPKRQWCSDRRVALQEVGNKFNKQILYLDNNSEFFKTNHRDGGLMKIVDKILSLIDGPVYTHNPWGEYGHLDHILVHQIAARKKIYYSDMEVQMDWMPVSKHSLGNKIGESENDLDVYRECKKIYDKYNSWTWCKEPITKCSIYENIISVH